MGAYDKIVAFQEELTSFWAEQFIEQQDLHARMMQLMLDPLEWSRRSHPTVNLHSAGVLLTSRVFNDFEAAKQLLLVGLIEQVIGPIRDAVECALLLHSLVHVPERANRWLNDMKEYHPAEARRVLSEEGADTTTYQLYDTLTYLSHPNMLASVARVQESQPFGDYYWRAVHFGGFRNVEWARIQWFTLLAVELSVLWLPLTVSYSHNGLFPSRAAGDFWRQSFTNCADRLGEPFSGTTEVVAPIDKSIEGKIRKRLKIKGPIWDQEKIQKGEPRP